VHHHRHDDLPARHPPPFPAASSRGSFARRPQSYTRAMPEGLAPRA
jgi:hypothetical protein